MDGIGATTAVSSSLHGRTLARAQALQLLFQAEACERTVEDVLAGDYALSQGPLVEYASDLALGAFDHKAECDRLISGASERWELSRMPAVDRNLLRISVYELLHVSEVPTAVTIDESVELAKAFGTDDSAKFINGVLGRIARTELPDDEGVPRLTQNEAYLSQDEPAEGPSRVSTLADLAELDAAEDQME